jgi:hypothetical protein
MVRARVLAPILHLGRTYEKGAEIEVDHATAHQLVAAGVIAIATAPAPAAVAAVKATGPVAPKGRES